MRQIGHQWAVHVFQEWDDEYRGRIAAGEGKPKEKLLVPVMGDLRLIRNDVIHHRGLATNSNTGRCKVFHWFAPGDDIFITPEMVAEFMSAAAAVGKTHSRTVRATHYECVLHR